MFNTGWYGCCSQIDDDRRERSRGLVEVDSVGEESAGPLPPTKPTPSGSEMAERPTAAADALPASRFCDGWYLFNTG